MPLKTKVTNKLAKNGLDYLNDQKPRLRVKVVELSKKHVLLEASLVNVAGDQLYVFPSPGVITEGSSITIEGLDIKFPEGFFTVIPG